MVRNNFMMHLCTVATLCFLEKTFPRNYYYSDQDDNSLSLCFKSMYLTLFVAIFTSNFIFSMSKSFHTYRNINISNLASRLLELDVGRLQVHREPLQDDGEGSLGLRGEGGGAADPGALKLGGKVVQVVGYQLVGCNLTWVELQLLMGEIEQVQACIAR